MNWSMNKVSADPENVSQTPNTDSFSLAAPCPLPPSLRVCVRKLTARNEAVSSHRLYQKLHDAFYMADDKTSPLTIGK